MKIRMLSTQRGAENGNDVKTYAKGEAYDLGRTEGARDLARVFLEEGWAERVDTPKSSPAAPENKALGGPAERADITRGRRR